MFTPKSKDRLLNHGLMQSDALIRCNIPMQQILENLEHTLHCVSWSKFQYTSGEIALSRTKLWIWTFGIRAQKINYHSDLYTVSPQQEIAWLLAWDFSNNFWRRLLQNCDETADLRFSQRCSNVNFWFSSFQYAGLCSVYFSNPISKHLHACISSSKSTRISNKPAMKTTYLQVCDQRVIQNICVSKLGKVEAMLPQ